MKTIFKKKSETSISEYYLYHMLKPHKNNHSFHCANKILDILVPLALLSINNIIWKLMIAYLGKCSVRTSIKEPHYQLIKLMTIHSFHTNCNFITERKYLFSLSSAISLMHIFPSKETFCLESWNGSALQNREMLGNMKTSVPTDNDWIIEPVSEYFYLRRVRFQICTWSICW